MGRLITDISDLVTLSPLVKESRVTNITMNDLGRLSDAWIALENGIVVEFGQHAVPEPYQSFEKISANGGLVMPGLVDSHTHAIFGGERSQEFVARLNGATYQEIAEKGGGISSTRTATRESSSKDLSAMTQANLERFAKNGVTAVEIKSGYGLSVPEELKLLRVLKDLTPKIATKTTCLALHADSPEHTNRKDYVQACCDQLLPVVKEEGLADFVDAFIETGYFSVEESLPFMEKARDLGLGIRLHADEFTDAQGAEFAAAMGAASADHLQFASDKGIEAMASAGVTGCLLPGTSLFTNIPFTNGRRFADAGCPVAIATDFNPGSCHFDNLAMLATLASLHGGLRPAESIAGVTWVPARSLGFETKGALAVGCDGDLQIFRSLDSIEAWLYDFGRSKPDDVLVGGRSI